EHLLSWANGNPGRLLQLLGDKRFEENREKVLQFVFDRTGLSAIDLNQYLSVHKDAFQGCMDILESVYRDALLISCGAGDGLINSDKQDNIEEYVRQTSFTELTDKITKIQEVRSNLKHYMNYQLAVDMMTLVEAR
ncbi:MAG: hypothetical protein N2376_00195, partial [Clostridia bacterium]|nr:hypothetical protein [Clostridia bacterium]